MFSGTDSDFTLALRNHAAGCITAPANLLSPGLREIYDAFIGNADTSVAQERVTVRRHVLELAPPYPPALKAMLARLHGQPRWPVRPPLVELSPEKEETLLREWALQSAAA